MKILVAIVLATAAAGSHGKSADECREEAATLPEQKQQQAVIDCLVSSASPSPPEAPPQKVVKPTYGKPTPAQVAKLKAALANKLRDPYSAVLADLHTLKYRNDKDLIICGSVNAKNAFGAYIGKQPFYFTDDGNSQTVWIHGTDTFESSAVAMLCK